MHLFDFVHFVVIDYYQYCNWPGSENIWLGGWGILYNPGLLMTQNVVNSLRSIMKPECFMFHYQ